MANNLYMIKIGGGSITDQDRPRTAKREIISRLLQEIKEAKKKKGFKLILGHGGGSFSHITANMYRVQDGLRGSDSVRGALMTKVVASDLNLIVVEEAMKLDMPVFPFFPSSFAIARGKRLTAGFLEHITRALNLGMIPMVYGDIVIDTKQGVSIVSTEEVMRFIASNIPLKRIVLATDVNGVYNKDPHTNPRAKLIREVNQDNIDSVMTNASISHKVDVTGGMRTKIGLLYETVCRANAIGYIANATTPGVIKKLLLGKRVPCTRITP